MRRFLGFAATFFVLFALTVMFMTAVDALPEPPKGAPLARFAPAAYTGAPEEPVRVVAPDIGLDVEILNPTSTDVELLDKALLDGAVRYPTSSLLGENGTVLLFGHSSYLPIVYNKNYKAFNGIQNLKPGQMLSVYSAGREYRYSVTGVRLANLAKADQNIVTLPADKQYVTLVTCDSFATKSDRFVITAVLTN